MSDDELNYHLSNPFSSKTVRHEQKFAHFSSKCGLMLYGSLSEKLQLHDHSKGNFKIPGVERNFRKFQKFSRVNVESPSIF